MTTSMTYTSLLEDAASYAERIGDAKLTAQLPRLLMIAENDLAAKLKTLGILQVQSSSLVANTPTLQKPAYWRDTMSFTVKDAATGRQTALLLRTYEFCVAYWPVRTQTAAPRYYADYNYTHFLLAPTPISNAEFELIYHPRLTPLSDQQQVNWFTDNAPQLLLSALMHEVFTWTKNTEKAAMWASRRDDALQSLTKEDDVRVNDRTAVIR